MPMHRRQFSLAALAACTSPWALAQNDGLPAGPVKLIVPFAAGGIVDVMARLVGERMAPLLKQSVFIENRPGATGALGVAALKAAAPDGQTILFGTSSIELLNPHLFRKLPYEVSDLQRISVIYDSSIALVVPKAANVRNLAEFVAHVKAKAKGAKHGLTYGSWGNGSSGHLFGGMLENAFGLKLDHVPYKGEMAALTDMARGDLDMTWASPNGARTFREQGSSVVVAVTGSARSPALPDVPTFAEQGYDAFKLGLYGVAYAPRGTPAPLVERYQRAIREVVMRPEVKERFAQLGLLPVGNTPAEFGALFERERAVWQKLIQASGVTLD